MRCCCLRERGRERQNDVKLQEQQQQPQPTQFPACPADQARADDMLDVLQACGSHPLDSRWSNLWQSVHAAHFDRQHRVLWWRLLHGSLMCRAYKAYIHSLSAQESYCPYASCSSCAQTLTHLFIQCPATAQTIQWLCQIWGAITGQMPPATAAVLLAADASVWQPDTAALQQAWHRLRLATLHSIWSAAQLAQIRAEASHPPFFFVCLFFFFEGRIFITQVQR